MMSHADAFRDALGKCVRKRFGGFEKMTLAFNVTLDTIDRSLIVVAAANTIDVYGR